MGRSVVINTVTIGIYPLPTPCLGTLGIFLWATFNWATPPMTKRELDHGHSNWKLSRSWAARKKPRPQFISREPRAHRASKFAPGYNFPIDPPKDIFYWIIQCIHRILVRRNVLLDIRSIIKARTGISKHCSILLNRFRQLQSHFSDCRGQIFLKDSI